MSQIGYIWPPPPPPNGQVDLREVFPRVIGKLVANTYRPDHVGLDWLSSKHYMRIVASFRVKYREDDPSKVWFLFTWRPKRGPLFGKGTEAPCLGRTRMEWFVRSCPYDKFFKKRKFLVKLAEVIGRARPYP
ncbi:MAG: hypothetical protein GWN58_33705 [Anaerolineae bacterium]|nr:hypothetical protein [Thermoplasmata archaeon]NIV34234.1 hypothetical protein [Anaerolineae bacterium]NIY06082.1 hypothetical protein [Thermoplasmata archaeon]